MRQEEKILNVLRSLGERGLSGNEAADMLRVRDLPKRISVLRREGHHITAVMKRDAMGQRYNRYFLAA